ncbi:MAG TPA: response regulator [Polyangiaceae bacterium]|jgi:CheY-like chemotaxis protein|nr:response regulator [Polyangiaceae bacterium]
MPNVLVFESDSKFAGELKGELERRGCAVTVVDDAAVGLQTASMDKPDLILLAIELPRMNGFSVCNKLKRDPTLKEVPLIIMSSDSTEETFEQHRRLRTHAEDYIHKPIAFVDLLPRISAQLPLPDEAGSKSVPPEDDIVIDDDIAFEEEPPAASAEAPAPSGPVDEEVDAFTESAFGNMVDASPPASAGEASPTDVALPPEAAAISEAPVPYESVAPSAENPPISLDVEPVELPPSEPPHAPPPRSLAETGWSGAPGTFPSVAPSDAPITPESIAPIGEASIAPLAAPSIAPLASIPPRPRTDSIDQALRDENVKLVEKVRDLEKDVREARAQTAELEDQAQRAASKDAEVQRLQRELDDVKVKAAAAGGGRGGGSAREFLDLREALNKKDKELLDLRDQISHKEKDLLGLRDTNLVGEREKADLSDRIGELEKQTSDATRQLDGARADKEQAAKRADDFKRKGEKLQSELDAATAEVNEAKQRLDVEVTGLRQQLEQAAAERATAQAQFETQLRETADRAEQVRDVAVVAAEERGMERGRGEAHAEAGKLLADAAANSTREREAAVRAREGELKDEHETRVSALHRANDDAIGRLKAEHTQMLADEDKASLERIQELETKLVLKHDAAINQETSAHASTRSMLVDVTSALDGLREQKTQGDAGRDARIASLENDISERNNELYSTQATLRERETSLGAATSNLAALSADLTQTQAALAAERTRVEKALGKWAEDKASLERAKDALAAALAQMDEIEGRPIE